MSTHFLSQTDLKKKTTNLIENNLNQTQNGTVWFCFIAEKARLVTLEHLHSFTDTCTEAERADSTDLWSTCMGLKKLLKWENSVESTKIPRHVKFSNANI